MRKSCIFRSLLSNRNTVFSYLVLHAVFFPLLLRVQLLLRPPAPQLFHTSELSQQLLVEILMRPTITMQKKKTQSKQRRRHFCEYFCHDKVCYLLKWHMMRWHDVSSPPTVNDDLVKDCLSVLYNCCICVSVAFHSVLWRRGSMSPLLFLTFLFHVPKTQMEGVTKSLAARDDFVLFLFTLMTNKKTFLQTATLIEDILGVKKVIILLLRSSALTSKACSVFQFIS